MERHTGAVEGRPGQGLAGAGLGRAWGQLCAWLQRPAGTLQLQAGAVPCLLVRGQLNGRLGAALKAEAAAIAERKVPRWRIDLSGVVGWDAEGLAALVNALDLSERRGCELTLHAPAPAIRRVLARAQLHRMFSITDVPPRAA